MHYASVQVTTHSRLLTEQERLELCHGLPVSAVTLLSLQAFDTEQQFCQQLRSVSVSVSACVRSVSMSVCHHPSVSSGIRHRATVLSTAEVSVFVLSVKIIFIVLGFHGKISVFNL